MNAEIVARLEGSFSASPSLSAEAFVQELAFVRHAYQKQIESLKFSQEILAHFLISTSEMLPQEITKGRHFASALELAKGVRDKDADALVSAYTGLFPELEGAPVVQELQEMSAKHKRGEDVTPYLRKHVDDTREKLESERAQGAPKKIILVGNIGREPFERHIAGYGPAEMLAPKQPANKGPSPSPNARKKSPRNPKA